MDKFVSSERGQALARGMNVHFLECSAKVGTNVGSVFQLMTKELIDIR